MVDTKKYMLYTEQEEWEPFFQSMTSLVRQIISRTDNLSTELKSLKD